MNAHNRSPESLYNGCNSYQTVPSCGFSPNSSSHSLSPPAAHHNSHHSGGMTHHSPTAHSQHLHHSPPGGHHSHAHHSPNGGYGWGSYMHPQSMWSPINMSMSNKSMMGAGYQGMGNTGVHPSPSPALSDHSNSEVKPAIQAAALTGYTGN